MNEWIIRQAWSYVFVVKWLIQSEFLPCKQIKQYEQ